MNPKHYHTPNSTRALCPVCKRGVYSPAGIHPQCAMTQSDPLRKVARAGQFVSKSVAAEAPVATEGV